eukprot:Awhi_evm1s13259
MKRLKGSRELNSSKLQHSINLRSCDNIEKGTRNLEMNDEGKSSEELLENVFTRRKVDVLGVSEHWLLGENVHRFYTREKNDVCSVIDYIVGSFPLKDKTSKVRALDDYCGSDFRLLLAELNLNVDLFRTSKKTILKWNTHITKEDVEMG